MKTLAYISCIVLLSACGNGARDQNGSRIDPSKSIREVQITAGPNGYDPGRIVLEKGEPVRLVFTRTTPSVCLQQVQIPKFGIQPVDLPINEPVSIEVTPDEAGEFTFACGMDMQHGILVVAGS
jgi:Cu+-exporting ATPase